MSGCEWVCVCQRNRERGVLSCCNETELMSRSRQFLLLFGTVHQKAGCVSVFWGTQFQWVSCVSVPQRKDLDTWWEWKEFVRADSSARQSFPLGIWGVHGVKNTSEQMLLFEFPQQCWSLNECNILLCKENGAPLGQGQGTRQVGKNGESSWLQLPGCSLAFWGSYWDPSRPSNSHSYASSFSAWITPPLVFLAGLNHTACLRF